MALTAVGFPGTVDAIQDAKRSRYQGSMYPEVGGRDAYAVTINTGADRTVDIAAGVAWAHGVMVTNSSTATVQFDTVATGGQSRWDALVLRRDWSGSGTVSLTKVNGTASAGAPMVVPTLNDSPGVLHDQLLALVQISNGSTLPTSVDPRRAWGTKVFTVPTINALPTPSTYLYGAEFVLESGASYRCLLDGSNNPAWISTALSTLTEYTGSAVYSSTGAGFDRGATGTLINRGLKDGRVTSLDLLLRRSGATLNCSATDAHFPDGTTICTVIPALRPDRETPVDLKYVTNSASPRSLGGAGSLGTDGVLTLLSGVLGQDLIQRTGELFSISASITFLRKVA